MTETRPITLGGRTFDVPPFPLRIERKAYLLCQRLSNGGLHKRYSDAVSAMAPFTSIEISEAEIDDLCELAFLGASAADKTVDREEFMELPIDPIELLNAFCLLRYQTGVWVMADDGEGDASGEEQRPEKHRTSTSTASLPA